MEALRISHSRGDDSWEAKVGWCRALSMVDPLAYTDEFIELAPALTPRFLEVRDAHPIPGRVQVLEYPRG